MRKNKGISLIVLIVTIVVIIILAAVVILTIRKNNPIESAKEARFKEDLRNLQDQLTMYMSKEYSKTPNEYNFSEEEFSGQELVDNFKLPVKYKDIIAVKNGNIVYIGKNEKEKNWLKDLNIEEGLLPKEYQQVEYIESTGTQYIDTKYIPNEKYGFYIDFYFDVEINTTSPSVKLLGSSIKNAGGWGGVEIASYASTNGGQFTWFSRQSDWINPNLVSKSRMQCYCINDVYGTSNNDITVPVEKKIYNNICGSIYLFAIHYEYGAYINTTSNLRIYEYKTYSDSDITQDFIPCYRKSDNVIGMYDTVEEKFYTNQGTGVFIKGPDVD